MRRSLKYIIPTGIILLLAVGYVFFRSSNTTVALNGAKETIIQYAESYIEEGAKAFYKGKDIGAARITSSTVDTTKIGEYEVEYEYKWLFLTKKDKRIVKVVDTVAPEIVLTGGEKIKLKVNDTFNEGFEVKDNYDGSLVDKVSVNGTVDTTKEGTYTLLYSVADSSGNKAEVIRTVEVYKPIVAPSTPKAPSIPSNTSKPSNPGLEPGVVYFTFDDGPNSKYTAAVLDILKAEGIKATFFVTGRGPDSLIKRASDEGHTIGLHTYTHEYENIYASPENFYKDLNKISERVERITGKKSKIIRFAGGSSNNISANYNKGIMTFLSKDVVNKGYKYFDWNVSSQDAFANATAKSVYEATVKSLKTNGRSMVLMHDTHQYTVDALKDVIKYAKKNGYTFRAITESTIPVTHSISN